MTAAQTGADGSAAPAGPAAGAVAGGSGTLRERDGCAGARLSELQRLLSLFAQGLAGRYLHLKPAGRADPDAPVGPSALREASRIGLGADAGSLVLPEEIADFPCVAHNVGAYRVMILHQLGYLEGGSFTFSLARALARIPGMAAQTHGVADERSSQLAGFFALWPSQALMRVLFGALEARRIDLALLRRYPGARQDLERVLAHALAARPAIGPMSPLEVLLEALVRHSLGAAREALLGALDDDESGEDRSPDGADGAAGDREAADRRRSALVRLLGELLDATAPLDLPGADVHDSAAAAAACYRLLARAGLARRLPEDLELDGLPGEAAGDGAPGQGDAPGLPEGDLVGDPDAPPLDEVGGVEAVAFRGDIDLAVLQRSLQSAGLVASIDGVDFVAGEDAGDESDDAPALEPRAAPTLTPRRAAAEDDGLTRTYLYDEWDYHAQAYLSGWCRVHEQRLQGSGNDFLQQLRERHSALLHQVRRQFRSIRPESRQRARRVSDGEELELDGIIETVIDRRAGHATDERLYMRRDRALRDVAAAFLLDMSASTDIPVPDPQERAAQEAALRDAPAPAQADAEEIPFLWSAPTDRDAPAPRAEPRRVIDVGRESMALMCEALHALGDRYAIYGFSGYGRDHVEFYVAKEFDDRLSARTWAAIGAMEPRKSTRMGPAIRHALARLEQQPTRMKVLMIVSDGFPQDCDYGPDRNDDEYGVQDTARALLEAQRAGVETFLVTIDPSGHDYLRRMCADERYMVIDEVADLPEALTKVYRALTV